MDATVKIGGSLAEEPAKLRALCLELGKVASTHRISAVPGGGMFADVVRELDERYQLKGTIAHNLAILAMDQYGILLSSLTPNSQTTCTLEEARMHSKAGLLPILLPSRLMFRANPLPHSWVVTSDSITAYIAGELLSRKLILVTDVDGVYTRDPKDDSGAELIEEISAAELLTRNVRTSVDTYLPRIISEQRLDCYVVNGMYPERVRKILENELPRCTQIRA
ncbi:MAG: delta 1-pyrroline-5-carboxylate synthetase [Candidatus Bathyarchaeota archaeon]|nr:delta 1-pyrroline-5-carboxylate synthetase [Candidatus Bathyarchaeota archaeon]